MGFATERENLVFFAKLAQQAERYDEMVAAMKQLVAKNVELTAEERHLLSVGYKNVVDARRSSWSEDLIINRADGGGKRNNMMKELKEYIQKIESEISTICGDIITLLDVHLIPSASDGESTAFYYKMKGDYYRYLAEFKSGNEKEEAAEESKKAYETATTVARAELPPTHVIRLNVAVNFSVLYYEILNTPRRAVVLQKLLLMKALLRLTH